MTGEEAPELRRSDTLSAMPMRVSAKSRKRSVSTYAEPLKIGARDIGADQNFAQSADDAAIKRGSECDVDKGLSGSLEKRFDALAATLADVLQRVKQIEAQPLPLPFVGRARAVAKHEDIGFDTGNDETIEKILRNPDALSLLAIKLAQRNGRTSIR